MPFLAVLVGVRGLSVSKHLCKVSCWDLADLIVDIHICNAYQIFQKWIEIRLYAKTVSTQDAHSVGGLYNLESIVTTP